MAGSSFGTLFRVTTWGESHGAALGAVIDGCPAGLALNESDIQAWLDRRKPGQSRFTTQRKESDRVRILSGVFNGHTQGTPISLIIENADQHSSDYDALADLYRPGHADYTYDMKYGFRDHRGGGRSSGRETVGRVAAGAIAARILSSFGIRILAYTASIGPVSISKECFDEAQITQNTVCMPDAEAAKKAEAFLDECRKNLDSAGGIIACSVTGLPAGLGEPVFDKLDALLGQALFSIGAVKGAAFGDGFSAAESLGSGNNDAFFSKDGCIQKETNHSGGVLGGISDGSELCFTAAFKPTPSIARPQKTVHRDGTPAAIEIGGRHDPVIVPRAVVVVEAMTALTLTDLLLRNASSRMEYLESIYKH